MSTTPNMLLDLADPTVTPGPEWASKINEAFETVDDHDHTGDKGKKIPIVGVDINQDVDIKANEIVNTTSVQFENLSVPLSGALNTVKTQVVGGNLWFTNAGGVPVQITDGNAIISNVIVPSSPLMPSGTILDFAGAAPPVGFLLCDGAEVSRVTYSDLFAVLGVIWGPGDGSTTFNLPNLNGRTTIGSGTYTDDVSGSITRTIGQKTGAAAHVLTEPQMPVHNHTQNPHTHTVAQVVGNVGAGSGNTFQFPAGQSGSTTATNNPAGGGQSHNNMQPSAVVVKMIKI